MAALWADGLWAAGLWADGLWADGDPVAPTITTLALNSLQVGVAFSQQLIATGDAPIAWTGTPPDGLTLTEGGLLSGTPTTAGAYSFTATATNATGSDDQEYSGTIAAAASPALASALLPSGRRTVRVRERPVDPAGDQLIRSVRNYWEAQERKRKRDDK